MWNRKKIINVLPYDIPGFEIREVQQSDDKLQVRAWSTSQTAACPECGTLSTAIHGWYMRHPQEIASIGQQVRLYLRVKRFRCDQMRCSRQTFAESLSAWLPTYARRTSQLTTLMRQISMEIGAEAAHRVLNYLRIQSSGDTLLRVLRHFGQRCVGQTDARIIGVDDWAFKRGRTYGTIIVNLETHRVIDLLPDRTAETLATWLREHPGIEIVSRDRSTDYGAGIRQGAPNAIHVADRWHLLLNLRQMLERYLTVSMPTLKQLPVSEIYQGYLDQQRTAFIRTRSERMVSRQKRQERIVLYETVQHMRQEGWNISQLARKLQRSPTTIRKYYYATAFPERGTRRPTKSMLDPYLPYLEKRVGEGCENGQQLWRELRQQGYPGTDKQVMKWLQLRRTQTAATTPPTRATVPAEADSDISLPSRQQLAWLLVRDPDNLTEVDALLLAHLRQDFILDRIYRHSQQFVTMVKKRLPEVFDEWLKDADAIPVYQLQTFAAGLRQDYDAIYAALSLPWSNGQTEGQVNRLKFIKRQMYGRAKFDLLRLRVLAPT